jgi:hypothetical protein
MPNGHATRAISGAGALGSPDEFWDDLMAFVEEGQVVPVVGSELLEIDHEGQRHRLYRVVAARLLERYGLTAIDPIEGVLPPGTVVLRPFRELNDAVCALTAVGRRLQDLYRPVNDSLRAVLAGLGEMPRGLRDLAAVANFDLFITTTCDDLLLRTMNDVRFGGAANVDLIEFSPNLSTDRRRDIPELRPTGYVAVFYAFGRASASPQFAIHDEDTLECVHKLQTGQGPERMVGALKERNLLLVGCNFPDWLGRFVLRVVNQQRLSSGDRIKREFVVDGALHADESFTAFVERFSQNTKVFAGPALEFTAELRRQWEMRHPPAADAPAAVRPDTTVGREEFFISYSAADRAAAARLADAIARVGGAVVWFDRHDLVPGDDWKATITAAVRRCSVFLPLLSTSTEARQEAFFREEWREAADRARRIQGRRFIVPIIVDEQYDPARYTLLPETFHGIQFGHAPGGVPDERLAAQLVAEIRARRR